MLIKPHITEKSLNLAKEQVFTLVAPLGTSKGKVVDFVKRKYKTDVLKITSTTAKGKKKLFKGKVGRRTGFKKFLVKLPKSKKIEGFDIKSEETPEPAQKKRSKNQKSDRKSKK